MNKEEAVAEPSLYSKFKDVLGVKYILFQVEVEWPFEMPENILSDIIRTVKGEMRVTGGEVDSEVY